MKQIKVLAKGYFRKNLGDDLFFKILLERYPNIEFYADVYLGYYPKLLRKKKNFHIPNQVALINPFIEFVYNRTHSRKWVSLCTKYIWPVYRRLNHSFNDEFDASVFVTGSTFMEQSYKSVDTSQAPLLLKDCEIGNKSYTLTKNTYPSFLIGANVGPVYNENFLDDVKHKLEQYDNVCFRDKASYDLYSFMSNVSYAPDVVFNLDTNPYLTTTRREIAISLIDLERNELQLKHIDLTYKKIVDVIERYMENGYNVNLISFCKNQGDEFAVQHIQKLVHNKRHLKAYCYNGSNTDKILSLFARCEYVVAGRFHAMILSMLFHKPFFPICYSDKMFNYLNDIDFKGEYIDIHSLNKIDFELVNSNLQNKIAADISEHIKNASLQFAAFDDFIKSTEGAYEA